jgi:hypothetical protein
MQDQATRAQGWSTWGFVRWSPDEWLSDSRRCWVHWGVSSAAGVAAARLQGCYMSIPPLTAQTCPVMYDEASAARKCTTRATSSARPRRPLGIWATSRSRTF